MSPVKFLVLWLRGDWECFVCASAGGWCAMESSSILNMRVRVGAGKHHAHRYLLPHLGAEGGGRVGPGVMSITPRDRVFVVHLLVRVSIPWKFAITLHHYGAECELLTDYQVWLWGAVPIMSQFVVKFGWTKWVGDCEQLILGVLICLCAECLVLLRVYDLVVAACLWFGWFWITTYTLLMVSCSVKFIFCFTAFAHAGSWCYCHCFKIHYGP